MAHAKGKYLGGVMNLETLRARCHVDPETGCWNWRLNCSAGGLAMVNLHSPDGRRKSLGRRAALELAGKRAPTPKHEAYPIATCFELSCCNPRHARWGTRAERMAQAASRGLLSDPERVAHLRRLSEERAKLTPEQRREAATSTGPCAEVAQRLGCSAGRIAQLRRGNEAHRSAVASVFEWRG